MDESVPVPVSTPLSRWLTELAQPDGDPGGGAASGVMLALAAALLRMVAGYTTDDPDASECARRLVDRRQRALEAAEADGLSSAELGAALRLSDEDPGRDRRVRDTAIAAAQSSAVLGEVGAGLVEELRLLAEIGNPQLAADLAVAAEALAAGIAGAWINLRFNAQLAQNHEADASDLGSLLGDGRRLDAARSDAAEIARRIEDRFQE